MPRLNVSDPLVFDKWRELYYDLTQDENIQFGYDMEAAYPGQASFDPKVFEGLFARYPGYHRVLEIGGWKGELARHCMDRFNLANWTNIDMCKAAIEKSVDMGKNATKYHPFFPSSFDWFKDKRESSYDICVSAHTIEHLTGPHVMNLIDYVSGIPKIMFEAPIPLTGRSDWKGYFGTHILEFSWADINPAMEKRGYQVEKITDWCFLYNALQS